MDFKNFELRRSSTETRLRPAIHYTRPVTFHYEIQNHTSRMQKLTKAFKVYRLTVLTLICVIAGILIGLICRYHFKATTTWSERDFMYIEIPGELYLRFLKLLIIPLLVSNVILSFGIINQKLFTYLAKVASFLYLISNVMAITVAIVIVLLIKPGEIYNKSKTLNSIPSLMGNHHYLIEFHDSINRYREYHPMYYHTDQFGVKLKGTNQDQLEQNQVYLDNDKLSARQLSEDLYIIDDADEGSRERLANVNQEDASGLEGLLIRRLIPVDRSDGELQDSNKKIKQNSPREQQASVRSQKEAKNSSLNHEQEFKQIGLNAKLPIDVLLDTLRNLVPDNLIGATMQQAKTRLFAPKELTYNKEAKTTEPPPSKWPMGHEMINQANIVGLLAISVLAGFVLSIMEEAGRPLLELCSCVSELSLRIGMMAVNLSPFCIMFLLIAQVARASDLTLVAGELFMYSITVVIALFIHATILLPLIFYLITKKSPIRFLCCMFEALVASFATSSSSATMALMLNCLADYQVNPLIIRAFGPLGSVFNMNGTAIYETIGVMFIAQTLDVCLPFTSILLIALSSAVASLSTTGIPSSGLTTMVIVLNSVNLPVLQLSLIYIVDFIIDRFRTVVNVWSGSIVCAIINHNCPEHMFEETLDSSAESQFKSEKFREMKRRSTLLHGQHNFRKQSQSLEEPVKQIISVTITPPIDQQTATNCSSSQQTTTTTTTNI